MGYLLFFIYLLLCVWLVTRINYFKAAGLSATWLSGLFIAKVACGVLYGFIYSFYAETADTWQIYEFSIAHYQLLLKDPLQFLQNWSANPSSEGYSILQENYKDLFGSDGSFWNSLKDMVLIKAEAVLNILSAGNYYVNVVLYAFITFGGYIAFYRGLLIIYPQSKVSTAVAVFLVPSCFFWTSGMYKDGVLFMLFGYIVHQMALIYKSAARLPASVFKIIFCLLGIFILRNYIVLVLVPCLGAWYLAIKYPSKALWWFTGIFGIITILFFVAPYLHPALDLPAFLVRKRNEYIQLTANSSLPAGQMEPTWLSYWQTLPEALNYSFLRPFLWERKGIFYLPFAIELILFYILLIIYFIRKNKQVSQAQKAFFLFGVFFLCANWLLLGYTAPIIGALVRYRSIFFSVCIAHLLYFILPKLNTLKK